MIMIFHSKSFSSVSISSLSSVCPPPEFHLAQLYTKVLLEHQVLDFLPKIVFVCFLQYKGNLSCVNYATEGKFLFGASCEISVRRYLGFIKTKQ